VLPPACLSKELSASLLSGQIPRNRFNAAGLPVDLPGAAPGLATEDPNLADFCLLFAILVRGAWEMSSF
jgi:hypothetical protein